MDNNVISWKKRRNKYNATLIPVVLGAILSCSCQGDSKPQPTELYKNIEAEMAFKKELFDFVPVLACEKCVFESAFIRKGLGGRWARAELSCVSKIDNDEVRRCINKTLGDEGWTIGSLKDWGRFPVKLFEASENRLSNNDIIFKKVDKKNKAIFFNLRIWNSDINVNSNSTHKTIYCEVGW